MNRDPGQDARKRVFIDAADIAPALAWLTDAPTCDAGFYPRCLEYCGRPLRQALGSGRGPLTRSPIFLATGMPPSETEPYPSPGALDAIGKPSDPMSLAARLRQATGSAPPNP